jgi:hypothetical protein
MSSHQTQTQQAIDYPFERFSRTPDFLLKKAGNIIVDGEGSAHIMMLSY